jgi:hypothetical protein
MRSLAAYLMAGFLVVLAMDFIAPPVGLGLSLAAWPAIEQGSNLQTVDRVHKSDRLRLPVTVDKQQVPPKAPTVLVGCDPLFSPLSASAYANISGRCVA